ncbi:MAG: 4Fe-4S dicluster domain-containing protein [Candidatus Lokiarchaeota archaeon]|nr:4Fe-4S dicluster domain-containing protein [Candidatus Lokiarchaeota archaeon]MBD3340289.1 4Fe-4S dicluster domain-containing protein [Candidatus Lokiarchaeota archaeon]
MKDEKLFPISVNPKLCVRCQRCMYSCHPKAIFFKDSKRYVNYEKCEGCLKCVDVCEHNAIEVISIDEGELKGFTIDDQKCTLCNSCVQDNFCFLGLFELQETDRGKKRIKFKGGEIDHCYKCLKCFKNCPSNAIIPNIE